MEAYQKTIHPRTHNRAFFAGVTYYQGRQQYTDAVAQVQLKKRYNRYAPWKITLPGQLPQTYVDAVIATERTSSFVTMADMT